MLDKKLKEGGWQAFFVNNPFVLHLARGAKVVAVRRSRIDA